MLTSWPTVALGDLVDIKHGFAFKGEYFTNEPGPIVMTPGNFYDDGGFKFKSTEKYYSGQVPDGYTLSSGDLLVAMTEQKRGLLGSAALVPATGTFLHNQRLGLVVEREPSEVSRRFLYYAFNSPYVRRQIQATANGAKVRHTSPTRIKEVEIGLPPLFQQERIAAVLGAYDELIENNLRRVEILEEIAQAVYREWFVNFRFPGHEDVVLVDSPLGRIPKGWEAGTLGQHVELSYGKALRADERRAGDIPVLGSSGVVGWHDQGLVTGPGIVVGRKGNVGSVHRVDTDFYPIDTTFYVVSDLPMHYLVHNLRQQHFINSDAAVPGLNRNQAYANPLVVPPSSVLEQFVEVVEPARLLVRNLVDQITNLRATRDLLLPKLISGKIDVSDLDIDTEWLAS